MCTNRHGIQGRILNATLGTDMCSDVFHLWTGIGKKPDYTSQVVRQGEYACKGYRMANAVGGLAPRVKCNC
jgi:hypothetical protein